MKDNTKFKTMIKSFIFFLLMIFLTFYMLLKDGNINELMESIKNANSFYIIIAVICMCIFIGCEGFNILRNLNILGYKAGFIKGIKYALIGFFFSSITPSASGGQPMQVYYMKKDNIDISHSAIALLMELLSYQINTVFIAIMAFFLRFEFFTSTIGNIKYLLFIGITINVIAFIFVFCAVFSKKLMPKAVDMVIYILKKFKYKKVEEFKVKADEQLKEYKTAAEYMKKNKLAIVKTLMITFIQLNAMYAITFFVYKSFGLSVYSIIDIISIQAVLYSSVAALPLPGGIGASEGGFISLFKFIFPKAFVSSGMILSRAVSFYLFVLIAGIVITIYQAYYIKNTGKAVKI